MPEPNDKPPVEPGQADPKPPPDKPDPGKPEPPDKPDTPDPGQGEKVDKKQYDELRTKFTQTSQENADLKKRVDAVEAKLNPPKPQPDKPKKLSYEDRMKRLEDEKVRAEEEGISTLIYDEKILDLEEKIANRNQQKVAGKMHNDFNDFINKADDDGNLLFASELDAHLYTMPDLEKIQKEEIDKGFECSLEAARSILLSRNMSKFQEYDESRKKAAKNAKTPDGEQPDGGKEPSEAEKLHKQLFPNDVLE